VHELAVMEALVATVDERVAPARVARVRLQLGELAGVIPEALRFCFEPCVQGTSLEGATLEIDEVRGRGCCRRCGTELALPSLLELCPCGSADLEVIAGGDLRIQSVELR
jgi:hydrogenase nickel incorporation protein HypA/HybF